MTPERLRAALRDVPDPDWLDTARERVTAEPATLARWFAAAARRCGRAPLPDAAGWTADEAARALLLAAVTTDQARHAAEVYRHGDAAEKRAVLRALPLLPIGAAGVALLHDAIRTNDTRLLAAALGPYARHLDPAAWRHAVLKCAFTGVPLAVVHDLDARADGELATMLAGLAAERRAAGREVPADAAALLDRLTAATSSVGPGGPEPTTRSSDIGRA